MLDRKLVRDVVRLRGQLVGIVLVVACGVATVVTTRTAYESLVSSQAGYYARYRFADVFASVERAPERVAAKLAAIPGVQGVQTRIVADVTIDLPDVAEPVTGRIVSIPGHRVPILNDVHLRSGRWVDPARPDEVIVSEAFASNHRLGPGDSVVAILNGRRERLRIVGVGLSPEFIFEVRPGDLFPDPARFGILWMARQAIAPAFDLDGAFDDVSLSLAPGAAVAEVLPRVDRVLARWGGLGAISREDQISHRMISDEIAQNRVTGTVIPAVFLGVAAFLLDIVLARLVSLQRDQIAVLKAFGYPDRTIGLHYLKLALVAVAAGGLLGASVGVWLGWKINQLYGDFYRFPVLAFEPGQIVVLAAIGVTGLAAALGAQGAVRRALALAPAEAMRPEAPARFGGGWLDRSGLLGRLPTVTRIVARNFARRPVRAALTVLGTALAAAILVVGRWFGDSITVLGDRQFEDVQREDVMVTFHHPRSGDVRHELVALPGVIDVEPFQAVPVRLRFEHRSRRVSVLGLSDGGRMRRLVERNGTEVPLPRRGLVLTTWLADRLGVRPGDRLTLEVLVGRRRVREVEVAGVVDEMAGIQAYASLEDARALVDEESSSGALLRVDSLAVGRLGHRLKEMPAIAGVAHREASRASFERTLAQSLSIMNGTLLVFAVTIACSVVYNGARIALSERSRELASLRVLGFTREECTAMLLGEQALSTLLAIPIGLWIGIGLARLIARAYQWELFRMPLEVSQGALVFAALAIVAAAAASGWLVRRRVHRLALVEALKTRE